MNYIFTSDIHMSNSLPFSKIVNGDYTDRILEQRKIWFEIYRITTKIKAKAIFILGDLFDRSKVDPITLKETVRCVINLPVKTYILPGNHDATTTDGGRYIVEVFGELNNEKITLIGEDSSPIRVGSDRFFSVSYRSIVDTEKAIKKLKLKKSKKNILLLHCPIIGAEYGGYVCNDGVNSKLFDRFDFVLSGHFHFKQKFCDNGIYLGIPFRTNFGESDYPTGIWNIDFFNNKFEYININCANFHTIMFGEPIKENIKKGDYVRINVKCKNSDFVIKELEIKKQVSDFIEKGIRAEYKHLPVSEIDNRFDIDLNKKINYDEVVEKYVEKTETDLNKESLVNFGKKIIKTVRK